jgi:hypothetical protein
VSWNKEKIMESIRKEQNREIVRMAEKIVNFTELEADDPSWGRGKELGTLTFRCNSDMGLISLFQISSKGCVRFLVNHLREKEVPKPAIRDFVLKLEANFLYDYDPESYPIDSFQDMEELFHTSAQVDKFISAVEGLAYRLRQ